VKAPPAEETQKLRELVESFTKSVAKRENMDGAVKDRLVKESEAIAKDLPESLPRLLALMEDAEADKIEVMKKVRGVGNKLAEEHTRTVLHLHPRLAPISVAVFPLKKNEPRLVELARNIKRDLQAAGLRAVYDDTGAIGKLYRRQDEIGTPWCVTVDFKSLEDGTVTVRDRDSMQQERQTVDQLGSTLTGRMR
jgi:glycyl-tRNA synthetase